MDKEQSTEIKTERVYCSFIGVVTYVTLHRVVVAFGVYCSFIGVVTLCIVPIIFF